MTLKGGDNIQVIAPGVPNITGDIQFGNIQVNTATGAFCSTTTGWMDPYGSSGSSGRKANARFDASRVSKVYSDINTVQPNALAFLPQTKY